jgi:hypothetical protein
MLERVLPPSLGKTERVLIVLLLARILITRVTYQRVSYYSRFLEVRKSSTQPALYP